MGTDNGNSWAYEFEVWDRHRQYIEHEDNLIDKRSMWNLLTQAFLFAAYAAVVTKFIDLLDDKCPNQNMQGVISALAVLAFLIAAFGIGKAYLALRHINAAAKAIVLLEKSWKQFKGQLNATRASEVATFPLPFVTGGGSEGEENAVTGRNVIQHICWAFVWAWILLATLTVFIAYQVDHLKTDLDGAAETAPRPSPIATVSP